MAVSDMVVMKRRAVGVIIFLMPSVRIFFQYMSGVWWLMYIFIYLLDGDEG